MRRACQNHAVPLFDRPPIRGATTASYTLSPATSANNGDSYTVLVANSGGSAQSAAGLALLSAGSSVSLAVVDSFEHAVLRVDLP